MPLGMPIPPSPAASQAVLAAFAERGIELASGASWCARSTRPRKVAAAGDGDELPYDLFLGVPVHRSPQSWSESGLAADGWVPVDPFTLETAFPDVYAVGDVASVGTPKAGVFAEGQASVVAEAISATLRGVAPRGRTTATGCAISTWSGRCRQGRRDLSQRRDADGQPDRPVDRPHQGEDRVREEPHRPLVRSS